MGDHEPDVGEQGARFEVVALRGAEAVQRPQAVEQLDGEARDLARVLGVVIAALEQLAHAATRHVAEVTCGPCRLTGQPLDGVEQHAVAQRSLAERHRLDAEPRDDLVEDQRAGGGDVGAVRPRARRAWLAPTGYAVEHNLATIECSSFAVNSKQL